MNADAVDLVVVGAGGGLVGALRAAELGLSVLVIEKNPHFTVGNNTTMSTAMIPGAGSRWQRSADIEDSAERFMADVQAKTKGSADPVVAAALAGVSARLVEWLADVVGLDLSLVTDFDYPGHSRARCHSVPGRSGRTMLAGIVTQVRRHRAIDLMVEAELVGVGPEVAGRRQVTVQTPAGRESIPARAVLMATSGFGASRHTVRKYIPEIADAVYHGSEEATGTALRVGRELGAATAQLGAYQGHAALALPAATLVGWATVMNGGFLVRRDGNRFGDESAGYSEFAAIVQARAAGEAWLVLDRRIHEASLAFQDYRDTVDSGAIHWASDARELAVRIGVDADGLDATLEHSRACALGSASDPWGRTSWSKPLTGELGAVSVRPALFHTQGGLTVDRHARIIALDGRPIPRVYASGGAAVGMSGGGADGYLAGNGLLAALGLAFLAAEHVGGATDS